MNSHSRVKDAAFERLSNRPVRILHAHPTFDCGGKEARTVRLMNSFGSAAEHVILSARPERMAARMWIDPAIRHNVPDDAPPIGGIPSPGRLAALARYMRGFDLVLTYNRGAANVMFAKLAFGGPPLVHHEDGFNADEALHLKPWRNLLRRLALKAADRLVVPSHGLGAIAVSHWGQPRSLVCRIPNGVAMPPLPRPAPDPIPGFRRRPGETVIGTVAGLRAVKNQARLIRCLAASRRDDVRLVIVGDGPEQARLRAQAAGLGVADRVVFAGFLPRTDRILDHLDIFALSSDSEQFPIALLEAMSMGLPIVATDVGDIRTMVSEANRRFVVDRQDEAAFARAVELLCAQRETRARLGLANLEKARRDYDDGAMIAAYAELYASVIREAASRGRRGRGPAAEPAGVPGFAQ